VVQSSSLPAKQLARKRLLLGLAISFILMLLCLFASVMLGAADISLNQVLAAFTAFDGSTEHLIIRTIRVPRAIIAVIVGAALAVAGSLMQGLTRNPLADPSILGIEAGAALAVVGAVFLFGTSSLTVYAWFSFVGAGLAAITVYGLGSLGRGGLNPLKLTIAGSALYYLLSSLMLGILVLNQRTLEEVRFWLAGSIAGRDLNLLLQVLPYILTGLGLALALGKQITALTLGEDVARGLGLRTGWIKIGAAISVILLAGSSVAVAGPIGFLGLFVPHIARFFVGIDYRWILPYSAIFGAILLLLADVAARLIIKPQELPVGVMTTLMGAPFFIYLARWKVKR